MAPDDGQPEPTITPDAAGPTPRDVPSRRDPATAAAAAQADEIPVGRRWPPALTLLIIIGVPGLVWALVWLIFFR